MSDDLDTLVMKLRALRAEWGDDVARAAFEKHPAALDANQRARLLKLIFGDNAAGSSTASDPVMNPQGTVTISDDARINGVAVGVNLGRIVYGRDPEEDERRRMVWYFDRLAASLYRLPLRGLDETLERGQGISLPQVYVMLATTGEPVLLVDSESENFASYLNLEQSDIKREYEPEWALPLKAIIQSDTLESPAAAAILGINPGAEFYRAQLATEAVAENQHLVLLGDPGSGKSTFLRHLAWALARRGLDQLNDVTVLFGWDDQRRLLPIIVPLRALAGRLAAHAAGAQTVYAALLAEIQSFNIAQADDMLSEALHHGAALLLFDGLDEVPLDAVPGVTADRRTTLRAVRDFAQIHAGAAIVITCRVRAFDEPLHAELDWPVETIAPFTLGQVRHFVPAWYRELVYCSQLEPPQAERMSRQLLDTRPVGQGA